ncbi:hypothetical protein OPIT5_20855 [Opitutaceae bacterium TAV5]|nr:hypothetical protein OPIT5_20855 [Opitutaceae bacterium TAV5]
MKKTSATASLFVLIASLFIAGGTALQAQSAVGTNLIVNGDFSTDSKDAGWPDKWGKPKAGASSWETSEDGKRFVRLEATEPDKMILIYHLAFLKPDVKAVELSCRVRATGLVKGTKSWFDARIMCDFLTGPGGSKIKGAKPLVLASKDTDGWAERKVRFNVPEGAKAIQIMPALFSVTSGRLDIAEVALRVVEPAEPAAP